MEICKGKKLILLEAEKLHREIDYAIKEIIKLSPRMDSQFKVQHDGLDLSFGVDFAENNLQFYSSDGRRELTSYPYDVKGSILAGLERHFQDAKDVAVSNNKKMRRIIDILNLEEME